MSSQPREAPTVEGPRSIGADNASSTAPKRDWDGFIPGPVHCRRCRALLHGQGSGYPAETYLGTYNGLCYPCTGRPPEVVGHYSDGAVLVDHPPHCPSWRRSRERFFAWADCQTCQGLGVKWKYGQHGRYPTQCADCRDRRYGTWHAYTKRQRAIRDEIEQLEKAAKKEQKKLGTGWVAAWATNPIAVRYRLLVKELWETPVVREPRPELTLLEEAR